MKDIVERDDNKHITVDGCTGKISPKKLGVREMLHSYGTWHSPRINLTEPIFQNTCQMMDRSWEEHIRAAPSSTTSIKASNQKLKVIWKMAGKKLVATIVSSREMGMKRREEGTTMSSQKDTETHKDQRDDKRTGNGGGRQKLQHVDGDFPWCMRRKSEDNEAKTRENENSRATGGGRQKLRHDDGDVPLSLRSSKKYIEAKRHAEAKIYAAAKH